MDHFNQVIGILNGRFPGQFECKSGNQGHAQGLEIRSMGRPGYAFIYEPRKSQSSEPTQLEPLLLALHETDEQGRSECRHSKSPDESVGHILPWAFPPEWTQPEPIDRAKEGRRLAALSSALKTRSRITCRLVDPDPSLRLLLSSEARQALDRDFAAVSTGRIKRAFPWDSAGRLELKTSVLLNSYATPVGNGRFVCLAAVGPDRRRDQQEIRVELQALFPVNQTHRWQDRPWMWQSVDKPTSESLGTIPGSQEAESLRLLDEGLIEDALAIYGVTLSDDLHKLLGGQRISPPACCARPDSSWTELLVSTLRQSAPWLLAGAPHLEKERIRSCTGIKPGARALDWKLAIFPGQSHLRKASLVLKVEKNGSNPRFVIEATASHARLADTSWKRPIEVDFARHGINTADRDAG
jgi:hypothetical protein